MGGAMFGDNLSFISDTTIAACNGQGCAMKDKFRENFHIAFPAALASLALILVLTLHADVTPAEIPPYNLIQIIPYVLVLIGGIIGINVFVVLLIGIVSGAVIALATGATGRPASSQSRRCSRTWAAARPACLKRRWSQFWSPPSVR